MAKLLISWDNFAATIPLPAYIPANATVVLIDETPAPVTVPDELSVGNGFIAAVQWP